MWFFEIEDYTLAALGQIFKKQLEKKEWQLEQIDLVKIFTKYKSVIKHAGDTEKLVYQTKIAYAEYHFDNTLENNLHHSMITNKILTNGLDKMIRNQPVTTNNTNHLHMYL